MSDPTDPAQPAYDQLQAVLARKLARPNRAPQPYPPVGLCGDAAGRRVPRACGVAPPRAGRYRRRPRGGGLPHGEPGATAVAGRVRRQAPPRRTHRGLVDLARDRRRGRAGGRPAVTPRMPGESRPVAKRRPP